MKIKASTAKVIQTLRLQSLASHDIVKKMIPLDVHTHACTEYLSPNSFLWREVEGASVGQLSQSVSQSVVEII